MGMILDDRIGHIVAPGLGLSHNWHPWFVVGNACNATAGALGQWASSALSFSSIFLSLCRYGLRCYPFAELAKRLNWIHDCTFLCEVEDERSNSQFVCILSGSTKNQPVALVCKGHSCKNLFSFSFNFDDGSKPLFSIPILLSCDILQ